MRNFGTKFIHDQWDYMNTRERAKELFFTALVVVGFFGPAILIAIAYMTGNW